MKWKCEQHLDASLTYRSDGENWSCARQREICLSCCSDARRVEVMWEGLAFFLKKMKLLAWAEVTWGLFDFLVPNLFASGQQRDEIVSCVWVI